MEKEEVRAKVRSFLDKIGVKVVLWDREGDRFVLPYDIMGRDVMVYVAFMEEYRWVVVVAYIYDLRELPDHVDREAFYKRLLTENFLRYANRYGVDWEGHLVALFEMRSEDLEFENFRTGYEGVLNTVVSFIEEVAREFNIPV